MNNSEPLNGGQSKNLTFPGNARNQGVMSLVTGKKSDKGVPIVLKKLVYYYGAVSLTTSGTHSDIDGADYT